MVDPRSLPPMQPYTPAEFAALMKDSHGWVVPRPDGSRATCGGPTLCRVCALEFAVFTTRDRITVVEGFVLRPGDKLLLIAPPTVRPADVHDILERIRREHPEVHVTAVAGFTGVQIDNSDFRVKTD